VKEIKLYKTEMADEGAKYVCKFIEKVKSCQILVLPNNEITSIGCDYIGSCLDISKHVPIIKLKLDMNDIGTEGLKNLAKGLC